jgi:hypothetical protein
MQSDDKSKVAVHNKVYIYLAFKSRGVIDCGASRDERIGVGGSVKHSHPRRLYFRTLPPCSASQS